MTGRASFLDYKIDGQFYNAKYYFTIDYTNGDEITSLGDDVAQHKQSHILAITNGEFKGQIVAQPNNRVRVTNPALWVTGDGAPNFIPSQYEFSAEEDESYMDPEYTFDNLYADKKNKNSFVITDFKIKSVYKYKTYTRNDEENRTYNVGKDKFPSVTTILSATQSEDKN